MLSLQEIRQLQDGQWHEELAQTRKDLLKVKFSMRSGHSKESNKVRLLKKHIAQLQTIRKEQSAKAPVQKS
ncbi:MAG: 50S ribosomal protein L29 [Candidatus Gracilibacteria bacterium]|jgi:ribosomal protein L29